LQPIARRDAEGCKQWVPQPLLGKVDFAGLKLNLLASIVAIASGT
jgi:hypothetical protein